MAARTSPDSAWLFFPKSPFFRQPFHQGVRRLIIIGNLPLQNGLLDDLLDLADHAGGRNSVGFHDDLARDRRLEIADTVPLLQVLHLAAHQLEILQVAFHFGVDAGRNIRLAEVELLQQYTPVP